MRDRIVFADYSESAFSIDDDGENSLTWYYVRVFQAHREMARASPIRLEKGCR